MYNLDQKILIGEINKLQNTIDALRKTMKQYMKAKPREKGSFMSAIIQECNTIQNGVFRSNNALHLIPLTLTVSYMHLATLKEWLVNGKGLYTEDNTEIWDTELAEEIKTYRKDFMKIYADWSQWRKDRIDAKAWQGRSFLFLIPFYNTHFYGEITDHVTGETRSFQYNIFAKKKRILTTSKIFRNLSRQ